MMLDRQKGKSLGLKEELTHLYSSVALSMVCIPTGVREIF